MARERLFNMRFSDEESERLARLSEYYGLSGAEVIRMLVKLDTDAIQRRADIAEARARRT